MLLRVLRLRDPRAASRRDRDAERSRGTRVCPLDWGEPGPFPAHWSLRDASVRHVGAKILGVSWRPCRATVHGWRPWRGRSGMRRWAPRRSSWPRCRWTSGVDSFAAALIARRQVRGQWTSGWRRHLGPGPGRYKRPACGRSCRECNCVFPSQRSHRRCQLDDRSGCTVAGDGAEVGVPVFDDGRPSNFRMDTTEATTAASAVSSTALSSPPTTAGSGCLPRDAMTVSALWDTRSHELLRTFEGHIGLVAAVAFSPDGGQILTGGWDNTARLWNVSTGQEVGRFDGHGDYVACVAFSPDGRHVLTASWDGTTRLWDRKNAPANCASLIWNSRRTVDGHGSRRSIRHRCVGAGQRVCLGISGRPVSAPVPRCFPAGLL